MSSQGFLTSLAALGRDALDGSQERGVGLPVDRPVPDLRARGILAEVVVPLPVPGRPDGPRNEAAATVRTDVAQHLLDARGAEGALVGADARLGRLGWQRAVAVLAGRSELEHGYRTSAPCSR